MLIEIAVDKALLAIVVAGADRRNHRECLIPLFRLNCGGPLEESRAEAAMLCGA